jgi:8-oxo-dGTP diphosphatase
VTDQPGPPTFALSRLAAGALFLDDQGRTMLVQPTYKDHWEIPGGYVEPGESPRAACLREVHEELGLTLSAVPHLVTDWAPAESDGDKILFVFDGGTLTADQLTSIVLPADELAEWRFVATGDLEQYTTDRLVRRIRLAVRAKTEGHAIYAEHGRAA